MLSKYAGGRYDLIQAGGGNSSVKLPDGTMLIKASGCLLSEVEDGGGYVRVDNNKALAILDDPEVAQATDKRAGDAAASRLAGRSVTSGVGRPSIEMLMHSLMDKYTLHTHPISATVAMCSAGWEKRLTGAFDGSAAVGYRTPGLALALELRKAVEGHVRTHGRKPSLVFLQNHGIIVSSDTPEEVVRITEDVSQRLEAKSGMDLSRYRLTTKVAALVNSLDDGNRIAWVTSDEYLTGILARDKGLFLIPPFCPDKQVYCGTGVVELSSLEDAGPLKAYAEKHHEPPRVIIYEGKMFFISKNVRKAKEMEEAMKFHAMILEKAGGEISCLTTDEIAYIAGWEAEKYRQEL